MQVPSTLRAHTLLLLLCKKTPHPLQKQRGVDSVWLTSVTFQPHCLGWKPCLGARRMPPEAGFGYSHSRVFLSTPMEHSHMLLSCTSGPKLHHRCVLWGMLMETLLVCPTSPASCHLSPPVGAMVASLRYLLCIRTWDLYYVGSWLHQVHGRCVCLCPTLEVKLAAGPPGKHVSLGMHMCSSLLVFLPIVHSVDAEWYHFPDIFFSFWAVFRPLVSRSWIRSWNAYPP